MLNIYNRLPIKRILLFILIPVIGAGLYFYQTNNRDFDDIIQGKDHYGTLILSCEVEGLPIMIDEQQVGITQKGAQTFELAVRGVYGLAGHEVVIQHAVDATHEYYFSEEFSFDRYIDVEENPVKSIVLSLSPPDDHTFPPINQAIVVRLKSEILAKQTGLIQSVKLQHNSAWNMAEDETRIYVLSRAEKDLYRLSNNEKVEGEFVEVYDKTSLAYIGQKQLQPILEDEAFDTYCSIAVNDDTVYVGDRVARLSRFDKHSLKEKRTSESRAGFPELISGLLNWHDYLIAYGEQNTIAVFKDDNLLYSIDEKEHYPDNITQIHDYWDFNRITNVTIFNGELYATNWRGFINIYNFADGRFVRQINTIKFEEEWNYVVGRCIQTCAVYQGRYLYFAVDYHDLLILDSQTGTIARIPTLFPEKIVYSELLQEDIDITAKTDIYKMVFYRHFLIFSEVNALKKHVYVYDLESGRIVHTFKGHTGDITEMFLHGKQLTGLSSEGFLYRWDMAVLDQKLSAEVAN